MSLPQGTYDREIKYQRSGESYEQDRYGSRFRQAYLRRRTNVLIQLISNTSGSEKQVLEVGCGTGINLERIFHKYKGTIKLSGVDISTVMLEQAESRLSCIGGDFSLINASAFELPFQDQSFDILYNTRFMHQFTIAEQSAMHMEFERVVRPGGVIVSEFYGSRQGRHPNNSRHLERYPRFESVESILGSKFHCIPLSFRGSQSAYKVMGGLAARCWDNLLLRIPIRNLVHEYFAVLKRKPSNDEHRDDDISPQAEDC